MKLRFTSKDFILLVGIMVAAIIAIATFFYRDSLITKPTVTKQAKTANHAAVMVQEAVQFYLRSQD